MQLVINEDRLKQQYNPGIDRMFNDILFDVSNECYNFTQKDSTSIAMLIQLAILRADSLGFLAEVILFLNTAFNQIGE